MFQSEHGTKEKCDPTIEGGCSFLVCLLIFEFKKNFIIVIKVKIRLTFLTLNTTSRWQTHADSANSAVWYHSIHHVDFDLTSFVVL